MHQDQNYKISMYDEFIAQLPAHILKFFQKTAPSKKPDINYEEVFKKLSSCSTRSPQEEFNLLASVINLIIFKIDKESSYATTFIEYSNMAKSIYENLCNQDLMENRQKAQLSAILGEVHNLFKYYSISLDFHQKAIEWQEKTLSNENKNTENLHQYGLFLIETYLNLAKHFQENDPAPELIPKYYLSAIQITDKMLAYQRPSRFTSPLYYTKAHTYLKLAVSQFKTTNFKIDGLQSLVNSLISAMKSYECSKVKNNQIKYLEFIYKVSSILLKKIEITRTTGEKYLLFRQKLQPFMNLAQPLSAESAFDFMATIRNLNLDCFQANQVVLVKSPIFSKEIIDTDSNKENIQMQNTLLLAPMIN